MAAEIAKDLAELEGFKRASQRPNVQKHLDTLINEFNQKLEKFTPAKEAGETTTQATSSTPQVSSTGVRAVKKLTTYALDESDKYVKLYYTLPGIHKIPADHIISKITDDAFVVRCENVNGVDYEISAKGFLHWIDPLKSSVKQKSDMLLVMLKKSKENETWGVLLKLEKGKEKAKMPDFDEKADPQESLMKMMKQMYDDGDDEMKRTIRKSWHESQSKKGGGDMLGKMPGADFMDM